MGWIKFVCENRDTLRNSEVMLQNQEELLRRRRELISLRHNAVGFIGLVFRSYDAIWVERCASIVTEG
jgi:hypothetical protein